MSYLYRCEVCVGDGSWRVERVGDVVTTWACDDHLAGVLAAMQRDPEITRLTVWHSVKQREWADISGTLDAVAREDSS